MELELFSGENHSWGAAITVDNRPKTKPTLCVDVLTWDYTKCGPFDCIYASPPCEEFSKAKTRGVRNLELACALVRKTLEIIHYFKPKVWVIENPATGLLPHLMDSLEFGLPHYVADFCCYGLPYRKRTAFWSNVPLSLKTCPGPGLCPQMDGKKHKKSCGNATQEYGGTVTLADKHRIPPALIQEIKAQLFNPAG